MRHFFIFLLLSLCIFLTISTDSYSQAWKRRRYVFAGGLSLSNYLGDIGAKSDESFIKELKNINFNNSGFIINTAYGYRLLDNFLIKLDLNGGYIQGDDSEGLYNHRGLAFKTSIIETFIRTEYFFYKHGLKYKNRRIFSNKGLLSVQSKIEPYLSYGFGMVYLNPDVGSDENQKKIEYPGIEIFRESGFMMPAISSGIGVYYALSNFYYLSINFRGQYAFSDYVDGFSSRFSSSNDFYYSTTFSFVYDIKTNRRGLPTFKYK